MTADARKAQNGLSPERIEKEVAVRASPSRVWRAITTAQEFGTWFRMNFEGEFAEGATIQGRLTVPGYEHVTLEMQVKRIDPERYFSYRWHPYAVDSTVDYSTEPTTLVEFEVGERHGPQDRGVGVRSNPAWTA